MKIVNTDNYGSDYPNERFVENIPYLPKEEAKEICEILNRNASNRYFKVVDNDYKLQPGFEP